MSISRRSFFAKVAGAAVATQVLPSLASPVYGSTGGAHVGSIGSGLAYATEELLEASSVDVSDLLPTFMAPDTLTDDHDICCDSGGWWLQSWENGARQPLTAEEATQRLAVGYKPRLHSPDTMRRQGP